MTGTLTIVATPIGNLGDMTLRALEVLRTCDLIACEDTRTSAKLLMHFDIHTPTAAYHKFNEKEKTPQLIDLLLQGKNIALISDAGMPLISDPGSVLVAECRREEIPVTAAPGASAAVTALALSGADARRFIFEGFLPADKKERDEVLAGLRNESRTAILYEAPHRIRKTLQLLSEALGGRKVTLCRELTKKFETVETMGLSEAVRRYEKEEPRGEFVIVLHGKEKEEILEEAKAAWETMTIPAHMQYYESQGIAHMDAMKLVAKDRRMTKREVYRALL